MCPCVSSSRYCGVSIITAGGGEEGGNGGRFMTYSTYSETVLRVGPGKAQKWYLGWIGYRMVLSDPFVSSPLHFPDSLRPLYYIRRVCSAWMWPWITICVLYCTLLYHTRIHWSIASLGVVGKTLRALYDGHVSHLHLVFFSLLLFFLAYDTVFCLLDDRRNDAR